MFEETSCHTFLSLLKINSFFFVVESFFLSNFFIKVNNSKNMDQDKEITLGFFFREKKWNNSRQ